MKLPVDTSAIAFLCALAPEPVVDFETKRPRADENGEPLYVVQLLAMGDGSADLLAVKVPGIPGAGVRQGAAVKVVGLVAQPWTMADRSGVSFRAARIEPAMAASQGELTRREGCQEPRPARRGGAGRPAVGSRAGPSTQLRSGARNTRPLHQEWSPMMHARSYARDPPGDHRPRGGVYDRHYHWRDGRQAAKPRSGSTPAAPQRPTIQGPRPPCGSWPPPWSRCRRRAGRGGRPPPSRSSASAS